MKTNGIQWNSMEFPMGSKVVVYLGGKSRKYLLRYFWPSGGGLLIRPLHYMLDSRRLQGACKVWVYPSEGCKVLFSFWLHSWPSLTLEGNAVPSPHLADVRRRCKGWVTRGKIRVSANRMASALGTIACLQPSATHYCVRRKRSGQKPYYCLKHPEGRCRMVLLSSHM